MTHCSPIDKTASALTQWSIHEHVGEHRSCGNGLNLWHDGIMVFNVSRITGPLWRQRRIPFANGSNMSDSKLWSGIILWYVLGPKKRRYIVTSSFICWAHIQNDLCWRFLCSKPELAGEQTAKFPVNCNGVRVIWAEYRPHYSLLPKRLLNFRSLKIILTSGSRLRDFMRSHDKNLTLCVPSALSTVSSKI